MINREALEAIYQEGDLLLGEAEGKMYLFRDGDAYRLLECIVSGIAEQRRGAL